MAGTWRVHGGYMAGTWRVHGGYTAGTRRVHGGCTEGTRRVHSGHTAGAWRLRGGYLPKESLLVRERRRSGSHGSATHAAGWRGHAHLKHERDAVGRV